MHLQVQAPLTTANLGLHLSQQSVSSLVSKHSTVNSLSSRNSLEAPGITGSFGHIATAYPAFAEDVTSVSESKVTGSSLYGVTDIAAASAIPVINKSNYLDIHATNTLSRSIPLRDILIYYVLKKSNHIQVELPNKQF